MQRLHNGYAKSIEQMTGRYLQSQRSDNKSSSTNEQLSFQEVLHEAAEIKQDAVPDLKFSKHAGERLITEYQSFKRTDAAFGNRNHEGTRKRNWRVFGVGR